MISQNIQNHRLSEIDLFKAFTIFGMIVLHVKEIIFSFTWEDKVFCPSSSVWKLYDVFLGMVVPQVFMLAMGLTFVFSRRTTPADWISRGCKLLVAWVALKAAYIYPLATVFAPGDEMTNWEFCCNNILSNDIFCFAGLFLIYLGVLRKLKVPAVAIVLVSIGLFAAGHFLSIKSGPPILWSVMGSFIYTPYSAFPFLNWILFPFIGLGLGHLLKRVENRNRLYCVLAAAGAVVLAAVGFFASRRIAEIGLDAFMEVRMFYETNVLTLISSVAAFCLVLALCHWALRLLPFAPVKSLARFFGARLTTIYCIQWLLIPYVAACLSRPVEGFHAPAVTVLAWAIAFFAASSLLAIPVTQFLDRLKPRRIV